MSERIYDNKYFTNGTNNPDPQGSLHHQHSNSQGRGGSNLLIAKGTGNLAALGVDQARVKLQMGGARKKQGSHL